MVEKLPFAGFDEVMIGEGSELKMGDLWRTIDQKKHEQEAIRAEYWIWLKLDPQEIPREGLWRARLADRLWKIRRCFCDGEVPGVRLPAGEVQKTGSDFFSTSEDEPHEEGLKIELLKGLVRKKVEMISERLDTNSPDPVALIGKRTLRDSEDWISGIDLPVLSPEGHGLMPWSEGFLYRDEVAPEKTHILLQENIQIGVGSSHPYPGAYDLWPTVMSTIVSEVLKEERGEKTLVLGWRRGTGYDRFVWKEGQA